MGACSLIWQVASARAIMAGLHGNELILGLVLGTWLVLVGGATALTPLVMRWLGLAPRHLLGVLLLLPVGLLGSLAVQQAVLPAAL